jgi:CBS-domain-containing membrane protein
MKQPIAATLGFPAGASPDQVARAAVDSPQPNLRSLPVIDAECRVLGMVSRDDLMAVIAPVAV